MTLSEQYADITKQIKLLEEQRSEIGQKLIDYLLENNIKKQPTEYGTFTIATRKVWKYTDEVKKLELEYKTLKNREEKLNIATFTEKPYLLFK